MFNRQYHSLVIPAKLGIARSSSLQPSANFIQYWTFSSPSALSASPREPSRFIPYTLAFILLFRQHELVLLRLDLVQNHPHPQDSQF